MELRVLGAHNAESKTTRLESHLIDKVLVLDAGGAYQVADLRRAIRHPRRDSFPPPL